MNIKIVSLHLQNFRGVKERLIEFSDNTEIHGQNRTGKSTIQHAFTWLLFGKDANDRADFEIKPIMKNGEYLRRADYSVTGTIEIDGSPVTLKRVLKEKWTKRRGSAEEEFTGHETAFYVDDVPYAAKDYAVYVSEIIAENLFKLITNVRYFNSLKKEQRREMLIKLAGNVDTTEIVGSDNELKGVLHLITTGNKTIEALQKEYAAKRKRLKDEISSFPARISEVKDMLAQIEQPAEVESLTSELNEIEERIAASNGADNGYDAVSGISKEIEAIRKEIASQQNLIRAEIDEQTAKAAEMVQRSREYLTRSEQEIERLKGMATIKNSALDNMRQELDDLRDKYNKLYHQNHEVDSKCPTCGQDIPTENVHQSYNEFQLNKARRLGEIQQQGIAKKQAYTEVETELSGLINEWEAAKRIKNERAATLESVTKAYNEVAASCNDAIEKDETILSLKKELQDKLTQLSEVGATSSKDNSLELKRDELKAAISKATTEQGLIKQHEKRVADLEEQFKKLGIEIANIEKAEFQIERFRRTHDLIVEQRVNSKFDIVKFRMFEEQINGGSVETCETLIDGVPYADANNASQINAGIDICNTFAKHLNTTAPIWIDNAEAVNMLLKTEGQVICMRVTEDEHLAIKHGIAIYEYATK